MESGKCVHIVQEWCLVVGVSELSGDGVRIWPGHVNCGFEWCCYGDGSDSGA